MSKLRIGTCSWKYDSWIGVVYEPQDKDNWLAAYQKQFNTVEIDQWFWSLHGPDQITLPDPSTADTYADTVSSEFRFTVKAPNSISLTHYYQRNSTDPLLINPNFLSTSLTHRFLELIHPLHAHLGPILFQFEYLNQHKMSGITPLIDRLTAFTTELPSTFTYAFELRNPHYLTPSYFSFLRHHNLTPVLIDGYYMPPVTEIIQQYQNDFQGTLVIRLLGSDRQGIEKRTQKKWNRITDPKDQTIHVLTDQIAMLLDRGLNIYVNVNNHFEGSAPLTIQKIKKRMENVLI